MIQFYFIDFTQLKNQFKYLLTGSQINFKLNKKFATKIKIPKNTNKNCCHYLSIMSQLAGFKYCNFCPKKFFTKTGLKLHLNEDHMHQLSKSQLKERETKPNVEHDKRNKQINPGKEKQVNQEETKSDAEHINLESNQTIRKIPANPECARKEKQVNEKEEKSWGKPDILESNHTFAKLPINPKILGNENLVNEEGEKIDQKQDNLKSNQTFKNKRINLESTDNEKQVKVSEKKSNEKSKSVDYNNTVHIC